MEFSSLIAGVSGTSVVVVAFAEFGGGGEGEGEDVEGKEDDDELDLPLLPLVSKDKLSAARMSFFGDVSFIAVFPFSSLTLFFFSFLAVTDSPSELLLLFIVSESSFPSRVDVSIVLADLLSPISVVFSMSSSS